MRKILPNSLKNLAIACPRPLYVVGGSVRDFLAGVRSARQDWDICAPISADEFSKIAQAQGCEIRAIYRNTGTVKLRVGDIDCEYSCFRSDKYVRGTHVPAEIFFTDDISLDAKRRDFTANAVYYAIQTGEFVDPLGGIPAIAEKRLTTVDTPNKVFGEDGLRLMRLARQAAQLGFSPDENCIAGAKANAALILDISPERIFAELAAILTADKKYGVEKGHYQGLKILDQIGVLAYIFPELSQGKNLAQRADFHKYDVLEHSLRACAYAPCEGENYLLRLAALLHDVGKPYCMRKDGNAHAHPEQGELIAEEVLARLKAPKKITQTVKWLTRWHMYDFDCKTGENKLRRFFVSNYALLKELLALKQADYSACMDDLSQAPTCRKWENLLAKMHKENAPFSLKSLAVNGNDLLQAGIFPARLAGVLNGLLLHVSTRPQDNEKERLLILARGFERQME